MLFNLAGADVRRGSKTSSTTAKGAMVRWSDSRCPSFINSWGNLDPLICIIAGCSVLDEDLEYVDSGRALAEEGKEIL